MIDQESTKDEKANTVKPITAPQNLRANQTGNSMPYKGISEDKQAESQQALVDRINASDRWMICLTAALVFTSIVSAIFFYKQWKAMNYQLEEMKSTGRKNDELIKANSSLAETAKKQADALVSQLRAYVSVSDAGISDPTGASAPTAFVNIKNTGQTPAYELTWRATFMFRPVSVTGEFVLDRSKLAPKSTLPPGGILSYKWTFAGWKKEFGEMITKGTGAIFAIGEIFYRDSFGNIRSTKYRLIHGGDSGVSPGKFGPAPEGNKED